MPVLFFGIILASLSFEINVSIIDDINAPSNKKGRLSKNIDVNIIDMFLIIFQILLL